jgi:hypothetical protein
MLAPAALALLLAGTGCDLPPLAPGLPFGPGETLSYEVGLAGAERSGRATLTVQAPGADGALPIAVEASHSSLLGRAAFRARSLLGAGTLRPGRFHDEQDGAGGRRSTDADLARSPNAVRVDWTVDGRSGMNAYRRAPGLLDVASALPYLRAAALAPGQPFCFDAVGAAAFWHVEGRVAAAREQVVTPAGRFEALRLQGQARRAGAHPLRAPVTIWLSADARRLPVAAELGSPLGTVRARLTALGGGR